MSKIRIRLKKPDDEKKIILTLKKRLIFLIISLIAIILALVFKVGEPLWPIWMIEKRTQIAAFITFILLFSIFFSPIIIETETDPRPLSGPGHNPRNPRIY